MAARINPIQIMADGTVKQLNPFSGTEVWTVPGRGNRPLENPSADTSPLSAEEHHNYCAFCADRHLETPPEKARVCADQHCQTVSRVAFDQVENSPADFRRVSNLFEIVTYEYWKANYGFHMDAVAQAHMDTYLADPRGKEHVLRTIRTKRKAAGLDVDIPESELLAQAEGFFGGGHDLIIGRRHFTDDATTHADLASAGTLTPDEHYALTKFTVETTLDLYERNPYASYVAVFQNWLKPAGASFDHLHKQLVAIDERGHHADIEIQKLRMNPNMYNEWAVNYAASRNLIIAENDYAIAFAGFGHRYPTLEVFSKSATPEPWNQSAEEIRGMSDLVHACHAAAGPQIPCNEEWHHKPMDLDIPMPWRIMIKWRVSTLAGFEGGTKVYLNTISPWQLRDKVVSRLFALRAEQKIANIRIAEECHIKRNCLLYNPVLQTR